MFENFMVVTSQVLTLFFLMGAGYALSKSKLLSSDGVSQFSMLALYLVSPCVLINAFAIDREPGMATTFFIFFLAFLLPKLIFIGLSQFTFRKTPEDKRSCLLIGLGFGNNGYMGIPLASAIFGAEGAVLSVISTIAFYLLLWTYGVKTMGDKITVKRALINPATVGLYVAVPLFLTGAWSSASGFPVYMPSSLMSAIGSISNLNTPIAMLIIGAQMARTDMKACLTNWSLYGASALRLIVSPLIALLVLYPLGLPPVHYCTAVILCGVPAAGATGMFAQRFNKDTTIAAQFVSLSTLISIITLPIVAVTAQYVSGYLTF